MGSAMALNAASSIDAQQHQLSLRSNYDDDCLFKNSMSFKNEKRLMLLNYVCPIEQFDKEKNTHKIHPLKANRINFPN